MTSMPATKHAAIRRLSYSSLLELHKCPRKFFLNRHVRQEEKSIHLSFGSAFGSGIQEVMKGSSLEMAWFKAFLAWDIDTEEEIEKDKKSLWTAVLMIRKFAEEVWPSMRNKGWELLFYKGKPTDELGFKINFFDDFYLLGFIDAVLINKRTGEIKVFECKTTKYNTVSEALYANSWQAIGYSVVLDKLLTGNLEMQGQAYSSYEVLYFVLKSTALDFEIFPFKKTRSKKAVWLQNIVGDIERIQKYEEEDNFPMYGESCWDYAAFRPCFYYGSCHMSLRGLFLKTAEQLGQVVVDKQEKEEAEGKYAVVVSLAEIIDNQLEAAKELSLEDAAEQEAAEQEEVSSEAKLATQKEGDWKL